MENVYFIQIAFLDREPSRVGWLLWNNRFTNDIGYVLRRNYNPLPFHECDLPN